MTALGAIPLSTAVYTKAEVDAAIAAAIAAEVAGGWAVFSGSKSIADGYNFDDKVTFTSGKSGWWTSGGDASRLVIPVAGNYVVSIKAYLETNADGDWGIQVKRNGSINDAQEKFANRGNFYPAKVMCFLNDFAANDYIEVFYGQKTGGTRAVTYTALTVQRLAAIF